MKLGWISKDRSVNKNLYLDYIPGLDGLRGVAIIMVVLYHNFGYIDLFSFGWIGVDLFFVLSGYLITTILLITRNNSVFLKSFYIRRILRIFPLYYLTLFIFFILFPLLKINFSDSNYFIENQSWFWLYLQNILFIISLPEDTISLTHLWSLAIEEQYYLIWPFIVFICKKDRQLLIILFLVLLLLITLRTIMWFENIENLSYFNLYTFSRFDGICLGSILAVSIRFKNFKLSKYQKSIFLLLILLNLTTYIFKKQTGTTIPFLATIGYPTISICFALLLYNLVVLKKSFLIVFFESRILIFLGRISYGLYIFHWPVYIFFISYFNDYQFLLQFPLAESILKSLLLTIIAIVLSYLSFKLYEKPFQKLKSKFI